jgi:hypothetical protein
MMVENVKGIMGLVTNRNQDKFGEACLENAKLAVNMKDEARKAAIAITSSDKIYQVQMLQICQGCIEAWNGLIELGFQSMTNGAGMITPEMLSEAARTLVNHLSNMIKVIKQIGDEALRVSRSIENVIGGEFQQLLISLNDFNSLAAGTAGPEDLINLAKGLIGFTITLIGAATSNVNGGKNDEIINAVTGIKTQSGEIVRTTKILLQEYPDLMNAFVCW